MKSVKKPVRSHGIVRRLDPKLKKRGGDIDFPPEYTVTSTTDGGGQVLTNVEVILCFWGSFWTKTPAPSPSSDQYKQAIEGILSGPFMGGLGQYRGVGQGTLIYTDLNDSHRSEEQLHRRRRRHDAHQPAAKHQYAAARGGPQSILRRHPAGWDQQQSLTIRRTASELHVQRRDRMVRLGRKYRFAHRPQLRHQGFLARTGRGLHQPERRHFEQRHPRQRQEVGRDHRHQ